MRYCEIYMLIYYLTITQIVLACVNDEYKATHELVQHLHGLIGFLVLFHGE